MSLATTWKKHVVILSGIYISRMFGMFLIFPVFSLYTHDLQNATPALTGIALGIYGLSQGLLQLPFGLLSDKVGRKKVLIFGLMLFLVGTIIAALSHDIYSMIIGRAVQGMGAISSVALALATDVTPIDKRSKVMAIIGGSIGMAFVFSLILGPLIASIPGFGLHGIFWVIVALVSIALFAAGWLPELKAEEVVQSDYHKPDLGKACTAVFLLHAIFTGTFVVLPEMIKNTGIDSLHQWWIYLPANLIAIAFMRYKAQPHLLNFGISYIIMGLAYVLFAFNINLITLAVACTVFFIGFYRLETGLPHWVANIADVNSRGKAMGIYSTAQFLGSFVGAVTIGFVWDHSQTSTAMLLLMLLALIASGILLYWGKKDTLSKSFDH